MFLAKKIFIANALVGGTVLAGVGTALLAHALVNPGCRDKLRVCASKIRDCKDKSTHNTADFKRNEDNSVQ